ncbi:hypothetical protein [Breoghania sp. JC706]|uniref:hypothetical protein n=1 Tax=Breoghania sp. JC706 TaxID=3117732 RepID=UPI00300BB29C
MSSRDLAAAACAMERARMRWERTESDADYIAFLEAEGHWQRCRIAELVAAVQRRGQVERVA